MKRLEKWQRQQSKDFYAVGFDSLVKRWGKRINVDEKYVNRMFLPCSNITFYINL
jgi:hypothetical protein